MSEEGNYITASNGKKYLKNIEFELTKFDETLKFFSNTVDEIINTDYSPSLANDIIELCLSTNTLIKKYNNLLMQNFENSDTVKRLYVLLNSFQLDIKEYYLNDNFKDANNSILSSPLVNSFASATAFTKAAIKSYNKSDNSKFTIMPNKSRLGYDGEFLPYLPQFIKEHVSAIENLLTDFILFCEVEKIQNRFDSDEELIKIKNVSIEINKIYDDAINIDKTIHNKINEAKQKADEIIAEARNNLAQEAASGFCKLFSKQAELHRESADKWLKYSVCSTAVTLIIALIFLFSNLQLTINNENGSTFIYSFNNSSVAFIATKITLILLFISITLWLGRMYKTTKHLEYINTHKEKSLESLLAFVQAVEDSTIRDAIVLEAARSIYATPDTGLTASSGDNSEQIKYIEILKNINPMNK